MRLNFQTVGTVNRPRPCYVQKAVVSGSGEFWRAYKTNPALKQLVNIRRETVGGKTQTVVYRYVAVDRKSYVPAPMVPLTDKSKLYPYQIRPAMQIVQALTKHGAALDMSDTGIGKTYQSLAAVREMKCNPAIICRKSGIPGWKRACAHLDMKPVFIINWERIRTGNTPYLKRHNKRFSWALPRGTILVFDEAHMANNYRSLNSNLYMDSHGIPSVSLSATMADSLPRLQPLLHVLGVVDRFDFMDWAYAQGCFKGAYKPLESLDDEYDMLRMHETLIPAYGCRVRYDDPDVKSMFPDQLVSTRLIDIGRNAAVQNREYAEMLAKAEEYKAKGETAEALTANLRYRQHSEYIKAEPLAQLAEEYLSDGMSVCVFVNFHDTLTYLARRLKTRSLIYGGQDAQGIPREKVIQAFQANRTNLVVVSSEAGGQSIDLHDTHGGHPRVALVCPTYNPYTLKQVLGRTKRAGGKSASSVQLCYADSTIEEDVAASVNGKLATISALNDGDLMEKDAFNLFKGVSQ